MQGHPGSSQGSPGGTGQGSSDDSGCKKILKRIFKSSKDMKKDVYDELIGTFGIYQFWFYILALIVKFPVAYHQLAILFLAPQTKFECKVGNTTTKDKCPCSNPIYDKSVFSRTIVTDWDLICERRWMASFSQTLFQFGLLIGSCLFGMISDRFGRRYPLVGAAIVEVVASVAAAFMPEFWSFTIIRFVLGFVISGTMVTTFVIIVEYVGAEYRETILSLYHLPFNAGHMLLPLYAYFFRNWVNFQLCLSVMTSTLLLCICFAPETARWYMATKQVEKAITLLERVAKINKRPVEPVRPAMLALQASAASEHKKGSLVDLFRSKRLCPQIIIMAYLWFTCSYCFYGLAQYIGHLGHNVFVSVEISASVTFLGCLLSAPLTKVLRRKLMLIILNSVSGACLIMLAFLPKSTFSLILATVGTVFSFMIFVVVYLYCGEMFPTVVRSAAIGFSSMMARVGSMCAPFVVQVSEVSTWLAPILFAVPSLIAAALTFLLPETKGCELLATISQAEGLNTNKATK